MKFHLLTLCSVLSLSVASAETTLPVPATPPAATAPSVSTPLPGHIPAALKSSWATFVGSGGAAELLGEGGSVIGTVNADGTVTLSGTLTLADVKTVRLTPPAGQGDAVSFAVTRDLSKPGAIKLAWTGPGGKVQSLPLPALLHRQADAKDNATAPADAGTQDTAGDGAAGEDAQDQAAKAPPGQGKGNGKKK